MLYNVQIRDKFPCMILVWTINSLVSHLTLLSSIEMSTGQCYVQLSVIWHWHLPLCIIYKFCMFKSSSRSVLDFCTFMFFCLLSLSIPFFILLKNHPDYTTIVV